MSAITTVTLTMSDAEQHLFDPDDGDEYVIMAVNDFLMPIGYAPLQFKEFVTLGCNVTSHPSVMTYTGSYRWFPRYEFRWFLSTLEWKAPEHVVLTLQTDGYDDIVWRPGDDKGSWKYPTLKPSMSGKTDTVTLPFPGGTMTLPKGKWTTPSADATFFGLPDDNWAAEAWEPWRKEPSPFKHRGPETSTSTHEPAPTTSASWLAKLKEHLGDMREYQAAKLAMSGNVKKYVDAVKDYEAAKMQAQALVLESIWDQFVAEGKLTIDTTPQTEPFMVSQVFNAAEFHAMLTKKWKRADITQRMVLEAYDRRKPYDVGVLDYLDACTGAPRNVIWSAMEREFNKGFVDYGVSLRVGYLTQKGKDRLRELRASE